MSTVSRVLPKLAKSAKNLHLQYLFGMAGLGSACLGLYFNAAANQEAAHLDAAKLKLNQQEEPRTIWGRDAVNFPWYPSQLFPLIPKGSPTGKKITNSIS
jgi:hypothetical protein